jgi:hypothetical protein
MGLVKKTIEIDQDQLNRIKAALKVETDQEAINFVLKQFDSDIQIAQATLQEAGTFEFEELVY